MPTYSQLPGPAWTADQVRRFDRERFVTALFAPAPRRDALMVLYAFNVEVSRVRDSVREPLAGAIRLQWWRDVVEGDRPSDETARHPVAGPLGALVQSGALPADTLLRLLEARGHDLEGGDFADLAALEAYAADTSGGLAEAALVLLGCTDGASLAAARAAGTAYALAGLLRAVPHHLSTGRLTLPLDSLAAAGISAEAVRAGRAERGAVARAVEPVGRRAQAVLAEARRTRVARAGLAAMLPAVQAGVALDKLERTGWDPFAANLSHPLTVPARLVVRAVLGRV